MVSVFMKKTYCKNIMILGNDPNLSVYCLNQPRQISYHKTNNLFI